MGQIADRLGSLIVRVTSPDGNIRAAVGHRRLRSVEFRPGAYETYSPDGLAHQLERLATLAFTGHDRGVGQIMEAAGVHRHKDPGLVDDLATKRYLERLFDITVTGTGRRELVALRMTAGMRWQCRVGRGALVSLSEEEFVAELSAAVRDLLRRYDFEVRLLKDECFGLGVEELARERKRRRQAGAWAA